MSRTFRGQSLVEFALVTPLFLLLTLGVIEGGRLLFTFHQVNNAAREAARYAAAHGCRYPTPVDRVVDDPAALKAPALSKTVGLDPDEFDVIEATWTRGPIDFTDAACKGQKNAPGSQVAVTVGYRYQPIIGMVFGAGALDLHSSSTMRIHY